MSLYISNSGVSFAPGVTNAEELRNLANNGKRADTNAKNASSKAAIMNAQANQRQVSLGEQELIFKKQVHKDVQELEKAKLKAQQDLAAAIKNGGANGLAGVDPKIITATDPKGKSEAANAEAAIRNYAKRGTQLGAGGKLEPYDSLTGGHWLNYGATNGLAGIFSKVAAETLSPIFDSVKTSQGAGHMVKLLDGGYSEGRPVVKQNLEWFRSQPHDLQADILNSIALDIHNAGEDRGFFTDNYVHRGKEYDSDAEFVATVFNNNIDDVRGHVDRFNAKKIYEATLKQLR